MSRSTRSAQVAAIDLGATSGRVMLADVSRGRLELEQVARFTNDPVHIWNGRRSALHWDVPALFRAASAGLAEAGRQGLADINWDVIPFDWANDSNIAASRAISSARRRGDRISGSRTR